MEDMLEAVECGEHEQLLLVVLAHEYDRKFPENESHRHLVPIYYLG